MSIIMAVGAYGIDELVQRAEEAEAKAVQASAKAEGAAASVVTGRDLGPYNAALNSPPINTLAPSVVEGNFYTVTIAGTSLISGTNFSVGMALNVGDQLVKIGSNYYRRPAPGVGIQSVNQNSLSTEIGFKNYPFMPTSNPNAVLKAAIKDIKLYNHDPNKLYSLTILRKRATVGSNTNYWEMAIYEWSGATIGPKTVGWIVSNGYTPAATIEDITLTGSNNMLARVTIDWSQVPDGTSFSSVSLASAGINAYSFVRLTDFQPYIDSRIAASPANITDGSLASTKLSSDISVKNYPFMPSSTPNAILKAAVKDITLYNHDPAKTYSITVFRKKGTVGQNTNFWEIAIYEWSGTTLGAKTVGWTVSTGYTPTATVEAITLTGNGGLSATVTVDWSQAPDGTNLSSLSLASAGISPLAHVRLSDLQPFIDARILANPVSVGDESVSNPQLSANVLIKNYPFAPASTPNATLASAIRDIKVYNLDPNKLYTLTILRRNVTVSGTANTWQIAIFEWTGTTFGPQVLLWSQVNYTPANTVETLKLTGTSGRIGSVVIDWSKVPNATNLSSINFMSGGISPMSYSQMSDYLEYIQSIAGTPNDNTVTNTKFASSIAIKNFPLAATITPNATFRNALKNIVLYGADPGKQYTFCILRKAATVGANTNHWQLSIYDWTGTAIGTEQAGWLRGTGYTPASAVETILLTGALTAAVTIDWSQVPDGSNFSSVSFNSAGLNTLTYSRFTDYKAYIDSRVLSVESDLAANQFDIVMPPKLYMPAGSQYWFYDDVIIRNAHLYENRPMKLGFAATKQSDGSVLLPAPYDYIYGTGKLGSPESYNLTVNLQDFSQALGATPAILETKTIPVTVKAKPTGKTMRTLFIGDSYIDAKWGDGVLTYIQQFATADGNTAQFKGTRTSYGTYQTEARASWNENTFMRYVPVAQRISVNGDPTSPNMHSPFMFSPNDTAASAVFDFGQYLTTYSIGALDMVVIFLGMNGGQGPNIDVMITSIKAALPGVAIVVCMVPPAEKAKYNLNNSTFDSWARQVGRLDQNISYVTRFAGREASNIFLCPTHMNFHRVYALRNQNYEQVQFNLDSVGQVPVNVDHHPSATGAKGLAYMIYNYMLYVAP